MKKLIFKHCYIMQKADKYLLIIKSNSDDDRPCFINIAELTDEGQRYASQTIQDEYIKNGSMSNIFTITFEAKKFDVEKANEINADFYNSTKKTWS